MPALPWKKSKVTRISRFVADLQTPKRCGSLVVETGFPTSLIDLFVKNRDRLKKPSSKKKKPQLQTQISDPVIPPSPPLSSLPDSNSADLMICAEPSLVEGEILRMPNRGEVGNDGEIVLVSDNRCGVEDCCGGSYTNSVFVAVLKISVVVVLALSTKKLAVGITMSAFLLLFLEYVGKRMVFFLKPCSDAKSTLKSLIQRFSVFSGSKKDGLILKQMEEECEGSKVQIIPEDCMVSDSCDVVGGVELSSCNEEIQIVSMGPNLDFLSRDKRWGCLDSDAKLRVVEEIGELVELRKQRDRSTKLKSKIVKKFVPKQLRHSKKKNKGKEPDSSTEISSCLEECDSGTCEEEDDKQLWSPLEEDKGRCEEQNIDDGISCSSELVPVTKQTSADVKVIDKRRGNSGYLILFLIVLAGLVGGRILAFLLTIGWCLMLKLVGGPKISIIWRGIRSAVPISS